MSKLRFFVATSLSLVCCVGVYGDAFTVKTDASGVHLIEGDHTVGRIVPFASEALVCSDLVTQIESGVFAWTRRVSLKDGRGRQAVRLTMDFEAAHECVYSMIPGISFNGNQLDHGLDQGNIYKGYDHEGTPYSFAWHRTTVPGATYSEGRRYGVGLFGEVGDPAVGLACSLIPQAQATTHRLIFPEEEQPRRIVCRESGMIEGRANTLHLEQGTEFVAKAYIVIARIDRPHLAYRKMLDVAWRRNFHETTAHRSSDELWTMGIQFARESLWDPERNMFAMALMNDGTVWKPLGHFQIGWCGRNGALANAFLHDYLKRGDVSSRDIGIACLDAWAARVQIDPNESNQDAPRLSDYYGIANDAGNLGAAAFEFLRGCELARRCDVQRPAYRALALGICEAAIACQREDGGFEDASTSKGHIAASLIPALLSAHEQAKEERYLNAAIAANAYYMCMFHEEGYLWGATLDTNGADSESSNPLLESNVRLYELTRDRKYLVQAEEVAYYHATWQIAQSIPAPVGSLMEAVEFETFGAQTVATLHMCIHSFSLPTLKYLLKLAEYTGNDLWKQRAIAMWNVSTIGISDGSYAFMDRGPRPVGGQDETYSHSDWCLMWASSGNLDTRNPRGSASQWLTAWPTAMRLDILADKELRSVIETIPVKAVKVTPDGSGTER